MSSPGNPATRSFSGRRLSRTKSKKRHFVHQNVAVFRASDPVMSVFMWGVSHTITDLAQVLMPVMLLPDDFKSSSKMKVSNHFFNKENLPGHFKFKEYCPLVFRNLRERFGVEDREYQVSLTRRALLKDSSSREARLFALSHDRTLVIKQICSEEVEGLHGILSEYHQHVVTCHGVTLLPHFLGLYRISVEGEDSYLLVSRNMFSHRLSIHLKYELKGSLVSREASDKEKEKDLPTFKDMDFRNNTQRVYINEDEKEKFLDTLNRDVEFLMRLKIMDYSVLLGIHDVSRAEHGEEDELKDSSCEEEDDLEADASCFAGTSPHGFTGCMNSGKFLGPGEFNPYIDVYAIKSVEGDPHREIYFMGIIDILTQYDSRKKAAHAAKTVKHGAGAEISTVNPEQYARRFRDFISNIFAY